MKAILSKYLDYIIRYYLSISLLAYAFAKILNVQFGNNRSSYLTRTVAELSGQELVWVFYSYSKYYEIGLGLIQMLAIILLVINKTKVVGILVLWPIFFNILLIDIFYEVIALNSILFYSLLLAILTAINFKPIVETTKILLTSKSNSTGFLLKLKNIAIILIGVIALFLFSLVLL